MHVPFIPPVLVDNSNHTAAVALLHYMSTGYINNGSRMHLSGNEVSLAPPLPPVATPDDPNRVNGNGWQTGRGLPQGLLNGDKR